MLTKLNTNTGPFLACERSHVVQIHWPSIIWSISEPANAFGCGDLTKRLRFDVFFLCRNQKSTCNKKKVSFVFNSQYTIDLLSTLRCCFVSHAFTAVLKNACVATEQKQISTITYRRVKWKEAFMMKMYKKCNIKRKVARLSLCMLNKTTPYTIGG